MNLKKSKYYYRRFREMVPSGLAKNVGYLINKSLSQAPFPRGFPNSLHIEISNTCNQRCQYCMLMANMEDKKIMTMETIELFSPYIKHVRRIELSGLAEPLLNPNLGEILKWIRNFSPYCQVSIFSNATLLTMDICEMLVKERLDKFGVSLDGTEPALVDEMRKGGSLERVIDNIRVLSQTKKENRSKLPIISATTVLQKSEFNEQVQHTN